MEIYPALDILEGNCVRLCEGDFATKTVYAKDPLTVVQFIENSGARNLHLVDLSGAQSSQKRQRNLISKIISQSSLEVQCGGGIRSFDEVAELLELGAKRVVVGSLALKDKEQTLQILKEFGPERITLAFDVRVQDAQTAYVASEGWKENSQNLIEDCITFYQEASLRHILCTDIGRDGLMSGPNVELYKRLISAFPDIQFQASGGVRNEEDLRNLREIGASSAIVGKAIYEGAISLKELFARC